VLLCVRICGQGIVPNLWHQVCWRIPESQDLIWSLFDNCQVDAGFTNCLKESLRLALWQALRLRYKDMRGIALLYDPLYLLSPVAAPSSSNYSWG
jgi:hypothetical protein